jgi:hypothetical protein
MKRIVIALVAGLAVFGSTFAFAAGLGSVSTGSLGAGAAIVAACDTDGVTLAYGSPVWNATAKRYEIASVNVTAINAACNGSAIKVTAKDSTGAQLAEASGTVAAGAATLTFGSSAAANTITAADVVIAG